MQLQSILLNVFKLYEQYNLQWLSERWCFQQKCYNDIMNPYSVYSIKAKSITPLYDVILLTSKTMLTWRYQMRNIAYNCRHFAHGSFILLPKFQTNCLKHISYGNFYDNSIMHAGNDFLLPDTPYGVIRPWIEQGLFLWVSQCICCNTKRLACNWQSPLHPWKFRSNI